VATQRTWCPQNDSSKGQRGSVARLGATKKIHEFANRYSRRGPSTKHQGLHRPPQEAGPDQSCYGTDTDLVSGSRKDARKARGGQIQHLTKRPLTLKRVKKTCGREGPKKAPANSAKREKKWRKTLANKPKERTNVLLRPENVW